MVEWQVISACAINESGSLFAVGSVDGSVVVWSTHVFLDVFWSEKCHSCTVTSVTIFQAREAARALLPSAAQAGLIKWPMRYAASRLCCWLWRFGGEAHPH